MEAIDDKIPDYLSSLEYSDSWENEKTKPIVRKQHIERLKKRKAKLNANLFILKERQVKQYCKSDPDATLMTKPAHNLMAYNTQIAISLLLPLISPAKVLI